VLAVGDAAFQKKCLGKMEDVAKEGRTVLFVSHQLNSIRRLCGTAMWIDSGRIKGWGEANEIVAKYEQSVAFNPKVEVVSSQDIKARFVSWEIVEPKGREPNILAALGPTTLKFNAVVKDTIVLRHQSVALYNSEGHLIWANAHKRRQILTPGYWSFTYRFPLLPLSPGNYYWIAWLYTEERLEDTWHAVPPMIVTANTVDPLSDKWVGILNLPYEVIIEKKAKNE